VRRSVRKLICAFAAVLCATAILGAIALAESALFFPVSARTIDKAAGQLIFQRRCASCHSVVQGKITYGPCLYDVGKWAATRKKDMSSEAYIFESIVKPGAFRAPGATGEMPENIAQDLTDDELLSVVAYLWSQGGSVNYSRLLALLKDRPKEAIRNTLELSLDSVERGRQIFMSADVACTKCHSLDPYPGADLKAPNLLEVGRHSQAYLEEKILHPSKDVVEDYKAWEVRCHGIPYQGRKLKSADADEIRLLVEDGMTGGFVVHTFKKADLDQFEDGKVVNELPVSTMPSYASALPAADLKALVDFLSTLR